MVALAGLKDDYAHDGRVLLEVLKPDALPSTVRESDEEFSRVADAYKAINAPLGTLGRKSLRIATHALQSDATTVDALDGRLGALTARRNALAGRMIAMLEGAAFDNQPIDADEARQLVEEARNLLESME